MKELTTTINLKKIEKKEVNSSFFSQDKESVLLTFRLSPTYLLPPNIEKVEVAYFVYEDKQSVEIEEDKKTPIFIMECVKKSTGVYSTIVPKIVLTHNAKVFANVYLESETGSRMDLQGIEFQTKLSEIDSETVDLDSYISDFEKLLGLYEEIKSNYEELLGKDKEIDNKLDELKELLNSGVVAIVEALKQDVGMLENSLSVSEDKVNELKARLDEIENGIDGIDVVSQADLSNAIESVRTEIAKMKQELLDYGYDKHEVDNMIDSVRGEMFTHFVQNNKLDSIVKDFESKLQALGEQANVMTKDLKEIKPVVEDNKNKVGTTVTELENLKSTVDGFEESIQSAIISVNAMQDDVTRLKGYESSIAQLNTPKEYKYSLNNCKVGTLSIYKVGRVCIGKLMITAPTKEYVEHATLDEEVRPMDDIWFFTACNNAPHGNNMRIVAKTNTLWTMKSDTGGSGELAFYTTFSYISNK